MSLFTLRRAIHLLAFLSLILALIAPMLADVARIRAADANQHSETLDAGRDQVGQVQGPYEIDSRQLLPPIIQTIVPPVVNTIVAPVNTLVPPIVPTVIAPVATRIPPIVNTVVPPIVNTVVPPIVNTVVPPIVNTVVPPIVTRVPPIVNTVVVPIATRVPPIVNTVVAPVSTRIPTIPAIIPTAIPVVPTIPGGPVATRVPTIPGLPSVVPSVGLPGVPRPSGLLDLDLDLDLDGTDVDIIDAGDIDLAIPLLAQDGTIGSVPLVLIKIDASTGLPLTGACFDGLTVLPSISGTVSALVAQFLDLGAVVIDEELCVDAQGRIAIANPLGGLISSINQLPLDANIVRDVLGNIVITVVLDEIQAPAGYLAAANVAAAINLSELIGGQGILIPNEPIADASGSASVSASASSDPSAPSGMVGGADLVIVKVDLNTRVPLAGACFDNIRLLPQLNLPLDLVAPGLLATEADVVSAGDLCTDVNGQVVISNVLGGLIASINDAALPAGVLDRVLNNIVITVVADETRSPENYVPGGKVVGAVNLATLLDGGGVTFTNVAQDPEASPSAGASDSENASASSGASMSASRSATSSPSAVPSDDGMPVPTSADLVIVKFEAGTAIRLEGACFDNVSIVPELIGDVNEALSVVTAGASVNVDGLLCTDINGEIRIKNPVGPLLASLADASLLGLTPSQLLRNIQLRVTLTEVQAPAGFALPVNADITAIVNLADLVGGRGISITNQREADASSSAAAVTSASAAASASAATIASASAAVSPSPAASELPAGSAPASADLVIIKLQTGTDIPVAGACFSGGTLSPELIGISNSTIVNGLASALVDINLGDLGCTTESGEIRVQNPVGPILSSLNSLDGTVLGILGLSPAQLLDNISLTVALNETTTPPGFRAPAGGIVTATINLADLVGGQPVTVTNDPVDGGSLEPSGSASGNASGSASASGSSSASGSAAPSASATPSPVPPGPVPTDADLVVLKVEAGTDIPLAGACFTDGLIQPGLANINVPGLDVLLLRVLASVQLGNLGCTDAAGELRIANPARAILVILNGQSAELGLLGLTPAEVLPNIVLNISLNETTPPPGFLPPAGGSVSATINLAQLIGGQGITVTNERDPNATPSASASGSASASASGSASTSASGSASASASANGTAPASASAVPSNSQPPVPEAGDLVILKVDAETEIPLSGACFDGISILPTLDQGIDLPLGILDLEGMVLAEELCTDVNGRIVIPNPVGPLLSSINDLPIGLADAEDLLDNVALTVTLTEIEAPLGYQLPVNARTTIVINLAELIGGEGIVIENRQIPGMSPSASASAPGGNPSASASAPGGDPSASASAGPSGPVASGSGGPSPGPGGQDDRATLRVTVVIDETGDLAPGFCFDLVTAGEGTRSGCDADATAVSPLVVMANAALQDGGDGVTIFLDLPTGPAIVSTTRNPSDYVTPGPIAVNLPPGTSDLVIRLDDVPGAAPSESPDDRPSPTDSVRPEGSDGRDGSEGAPEASGSATGVTGLPSTGAGSEPMAGMLIVLMLVSLLVGVAATMGFRLRRFSDRR